jgi:hypothetical protein
MSSDKVIRLIPEGTYTGRVIDTGSTYTNKGKYVVHIVLALPNEQYVQHNIVFGDTAVWLYVKNTSAAVEVRVRHRTVPHGETEVTFPEVTILRVSTPTDA